jgi:hypothetical protein
MAVATEPNSLEEKIQGGEDESAPCALVLEDSLKLKAKPKRTALFDFSNTEAIKDKVRAAKKNKKKAYNVHNAYHAEGLFQFIAKHTYFENTTLGVIVINALWISVDTDGNTADTMFQAKWYFNVMDSLFFIYFVLEVLIRFCAFKRKIDCLKDNWFKFDLILVILYAFDPFTLSIIAKVQGGSGLNLPTAILRLFRLARLSRLVRMLRSLPELMIMVKGMVTATSSVVYSLGLLMIITYVFAIAVRNLLPTKTEEECMLEYEDDCIENQFFPNVPQSMHNLIIFASFCDDLQPFMWALKAQMPPILVLAWIYVALASLTVMNMLIGVLCEVISAVALEENESVMVDQVHEKFGAIVETLDENNDGTISWDEFKAMLELPEALKALEEVNVNPESMVDMAEDVFFEDGEPVAVPMEDFMGMVLDLRGGQQATVENIMGLGKRFSQKFMTVQSRIVNLENTVSTMSQRSDQIDFKLGQILDALKADVSVSSIP